MESEDLEEMLRTVQRVQQEIQRMALHPLAEIEERLTRELMQRQAAKVKKSEIDAAAAPYVCPNCHGVGGLHSGMDVCPPDPTEMDEEGPDIELETRWFV